MQQMSRHSTVGPIWLIVFLLFLLAVPGLADARPGTVTTDFGVSDVAGALVLQPDEKLVAAGFTGISAGGSEVEDFILVRYLPDGRLDPTFGTGGVVTTDFAERDRYGGSLGPAARW